jgi:GH25 family lysozyme M1 (1,4-beta-N-acetylmuramidase)
VKKVKNRIYCTLFVFLILIFNPNTPTVSAEVDYLGAYKYIWAKIVSDSWISKKYDYNMDGKINIYDMAFAKKRLIDNVVGLPDVNLVTKGIDVSYAQKEIDWEMVDSAGEIDFVIIRAGYGSSREPSQVDEYFVQNMEGAKSVGMPVGIYWYSYATNTEMALEEAKYCIDTIKGYKIQYPVYFDIEERRQANLGAEVCSEITDTFCSTLEKAGYYVGIYSYKNFLENYITPAVRAKYVLWIAQWADENTYEGNFGMWQYTSNGSVAGIEGRVDMNICYKNYPAIINFYHKNNY